MRYGFIKLPWEILEQMMGSQEIHIHHKLDSPVGNISCMKDINNMEYWIKVIEWFWYTIFSSNSFFIYLVFQRVVTGNS